MAVVCQHELKCIIIIIYYVHHPLTLDCITATRLIITDDVYVELAAGDRVVAIATVTWRAEDAVRAEREAVIGRRVAIVRAGVLERAQPVAAGEPHRWLGNHGRRL